jgi:hypothetical protein
VLLAGLVFIGIGSVGVTGAVVLEIIKKEPLYMLLMKIFPWFIGVGGILIGCS